MNIHQPFHPDRDPSSVMNDSGAFGTDFFFKEMNSNHENKDSENITSFETSGNHLLEKKRNQV